MTDSTIRDQGAMLARVSSGDIVIYANAALAEYLGIPKDELIGAPLETLARHCQGEISECFSRPAPGTQPTSRLVADGAGRVFEAKVRTDGSVFDVILDEVTTAERIGAGLMAATGTPFQNLTEEELRTSRRPEKRPISITFLILQDIVRLADHLSPMETRFLVDSLIEEAAEAIQKTESTLGSATGSSLVGISGAPRNHRDHPLRAIKTACDVSERVETLRMAYANEGREVPPFSCGIWTGECLVGTLGAGVVRHYTALGQPVDLAKQLGRLARPGETLLPERTLSHLIEVLPEGWSFLRTSRESDPDLEYPPWDCGNIEPLPDPLRRVVFLIGPDAENAPDRAEYFFDYQWCLRIPGRDTPEPILRVTRASPVGDTIELRSDNVITNEVSQTFGKYRLIEVLGTGGMGRVWRAVDRFGNQVAIKTLHSEEALNEAQLKRFRREAEIMLRLPHRNICRVFEMNESEGIQYIAMEYVEGLSLADLIRDVDDGESATGQPVPLAELIRSVRRRRKQASHETEPPQEPRRPAKKVTRILPVPQTTGIMLRVCDAIQFAHEHGVLHRDLKPGNILLREDGEPVVVDFGLAKWNRADATQSLSVSGHVLGTLENMPPEQAESSRDVDERADVYALGTILFQLLTGRRHFEATGNLVADAQALRTHEPPRLRSLNPKIDPELELITLKALRNNPATRYQSVTALREDLNRYRRGQVISARRISSWERLRRSIRRNPTAAAIALTSMVVIGTTVVTAIWSLSQQLARETTARREAEELRAEAEFHKKEAEIRRTEAEAKERLAKKNAQVAQEQLVRARQLLEEKLAAEKAAAEARIRSAEALSNQEAERKLRQKAEEEKAEKESELARLLQEMQAIQEAGNLTAGESSREDANLALRDSAKNEALAILRFELSPYALDAMDKNPERALALISRGQAALARALMVRPNDPECWNLKGRYHLAALEFAGARAAFSMAQDAPQNPSPPSSPPRNPNTPAGLAAPLAEGLLRTDEAIERLLASKDPLDHTIGHLMKFFSDKAFFLRKARDARPPALGRIYEPEEIALAIFLVNSLQSPPILSRAPDGEGAMTVTISGDTHDLSALADLPITEVTLRDCSKADWSVIARLPIESLDVSSTSIEALPGVVRGFERLRTLNISNTRIFSLEALPKMPRIETLIASGCAIQDLTPLAGCRHLKVLDLGGNRLLNFRPLLNLPLQSLTITRRKIPSLLPELNTLRRHRSLKVLRDPADPPDQPPQVFWAKLDNMPTGSPEPPAD